MKPIEIIKNAYNKKKIELQFELPLDKDEKLDVVLTAPDVYAIIEVQEEMYQSKYAEYRDKAYDKRPINEADWQKEIELYEGTAREQAEKDKPKNLAEQMAKKFAKIRTVQELIPMFLRDTKGNKVCETIEEREAFKEILCSNPDLMQLLAQKYIELSGMISKVGEKAKNS